RRCFPLEREDHRWRRLVGPGTVVAEQFLPTQDVENERLLLRADRCGAESGRRERGELGVHAGRADDETGSGRVAKRRSARPSASRSTPATRLIVEGATALPGRNVHSVSTAPSRRQMCPINPYTCSAPRWAFGSSEITGVRRSSSRRAIVACRGSSARKKKAEPAKTRVLVTAMLIALRAKA